MSLYFGSVVESTFVLHTSILFIAVSCFGHAPWPGMVKACIIRMIFVGLLYNCLASSITFN
jgi:hypothetical protein